MEYVINDEYGYQKDYAYLDKVIQKTLEVEQVKHAVFSIIFVDEKTIQTINKTYRNIDRVTDVISFALEDNEVVFEPIRTLGDIYVCIPKMQAQAIEYGHSEMRELSFLVVHGLLHLLGYDHQEKEEETVMFQKQEMILNELNITR